ncbi:hypothetical protein ANCCAN_09815 [Ancylostoma caninum]|uniref:Transposase IS30-like HTH domain-containing protein n=1 Tax=Ancylostoma caninum TaxID=29170 RepID=A0A368GII9_ANCCA|nr:hypothetical protein ANCCAN_09815 [Ancylostoma caninum]
MVALHLQRSSVVDLHRAGYATKDIVRILSVPRRTVQRAVQLFKSTVSGRYRSSRPRSAVTKKNADIIRKRIARSPKRSMREIAADLGISESSVRRIVHKELGLRSYRLQKCQALSAADRLTRVRRCKELLKRAANDAHLQFVFSDEKLFSVEATFNRRNKRIIARCKWVQIPVEGLLPRRPTLPG